MTMVNTNKFVMTVRSTSLPKVILSVPHDGLLSKDLSGQFTIRKRGIHGSDLYVTPIANGIFTRCNDHGVGVDLVRFLMPRTYVDVNRPTKERGSLREGDGNAFDDESLRIYYDAYFSELETSISRGLDEYGKEDIILLDLHGFRQGRRSGQMTDFDVILGTRHRKTIKYGSPDKELYRILSENGFNTFLPGEQNVLPNGDPYAGGFISKYLSSAYGINVIQIEIERYLRVKESTDDSLKLAKAIGDWLVSICK